MSEPSSADVFVIFGITGDLAKVMTFRSLYRLEQRKLIDCPIVGVAVDDWSVEQLVQRARESIVGTGEQLDEDVFARLAARFSYVPGDFGDADTYERVAAAIKGEGAPGLLPRDPAVPVLDRGQGTLGGGPHEERPGRGREAVRARPRVGESARRGPPPVHRRVAAVPHRPLPREDGARGDPLPAVREHDAGAGLEPELHRERADHDGRGLRRRGSRPLLRPGRRVARRGREPPDAGGRRDGDGGARGRRSPDPEGRPDRGVQGGRHRRPGPLPARPVRGVPVDRRGRPRFDDRDVRRPSPRDRELALVGGSLLHPDGEAPPGDADRAPGRVQDAHPSWASGCADPTRNPARSSSSSTRRPASASSSTRATPANSARRRRSISTWSSRRRAARAPRPTRCCCTRR